MPMRVRRGLPRVPGGEPWPPVAMIGARDDAGVATEPSRDLSSPPAGADEQWATPPGEQRAQATPTAVVRGTVALRRGLPRIAGGEPWPPEGFAPAPGESGATGSDLGHAAVPAAADLPAPTNPAAPTNTAAPSHQDVPSRAVGMSRRARRVLGVAVLTLFLGGAAVVGARALMSVDAVADLVAAYPGAVPPPEGAPVGIPTWLSWQHFFNVFLLALIVRTGLQVRRQARPEAYWARRSDPKTRISLIAWTHQALDVLWVINGVTYVVLLFATGQWMRIVPLSWDVIPNAASTALLYLSLDWPVEDGWAYYNALQQLSYFVTVFVAAPLAIASGVRISMFWRAGGPLDRIYPVTVARRIHVPVMLYFVVFVVSHVALVLATGARRNLNHMFAGTQGESWTGAVVAAAALLVIAAAVLAVRPVLIAPVARRFGAVSGR